LPPGEGVDAEMLEAGGEGVIHGDDDGTLETCLSINPMHEEALKFRKYISSVCLS
jgi:hypothetical protein